MYPCPRRREEQMSKMSVPGPHDTVIRNPSTIIVLLSRVEQPLTVRCTPSFLAIIILASSTREVVLTNKAIVFPLRVMMEMDEGGERDRQENTFCKENIASESGKIFPHPLSLHSLILLSQS